MATPTGVRCHLIVISIYISVMSSNIDYLFKYLMVIFVLLGKSAYASYLLIFKLDYLGGGLWQMSCMSSLYILDNSYLPDT